MITLGANIRNRVRKLPKPSNASQGLQPLFEAVSNAFFAIDDRTVNSKLLFRPEINITVLNLSDPDKIKIIVSDNGIGLDEDRFKAFCTIDTDFKSEKGGKGVGRLFWLDSFKRVEIQSSYGDLNSLNHRSFLFCLRNKDQIEQIDNDLSGRKISGTKIIFSGLHAEGYRKYFPKRKDTFLRYFSSHFIADFLVGKGAKVIVNLDGDIIEYPSSISQLVIDNKLSGKTEEHEEFGELEIKGFICREEASSGLDGNHQLHLLADGRSVEARKIDKLIGLSKISIGEEHGLVFHGSVSGKYLNEHVNEGRTAFNLRETKLKEVCRFCSDFIKENFLQPEVKKYEQERREGYQNFVQRYPIYGFADEDKQLSRVPFGATKAEEFATGLVKYQIRRDEDRQNEIEKVITLLENDEDVTESFADRVLEASRELQQSEQLALAQHVVRRKLVLELLEKLILRIRKRGEREEDFHLESTLHSFIVPMRINGLDSNLKESSSHDLWIVDERLAFTRSFASDERLAKTLASSDSEVRPDLLVWNLAHGLGVVDPNSKRTEVDVSEPLKKVMIVEFKRPGRRAYNKVEDQLEQQITKYLRQLKNGEVETFNNQRVRIAPDCLFYCYVVADIVGDLEEQLAGWPTTANGEGRVRSLDSDFKGSTIEVIQWQDLVNDAWARNEATLFAAGLRRSES